MVVMNSDDGRLTIGAFGELVGLSVPQLRRYDRLDLLTPDGRTDAGYRTYSTGQTGAGRAIALLRSMTCRSPTFARCSPERAKTSAASCSRLTEPGSRPASTRRDVCSRQSINTPRRTP